MQRRPVILWDCSLSPIEEDLDLIASLRAAAASIVTGRLRPTDQVLLYGELARVGSIGDGTYRDWSWGTNLAHAVELAATHVAEADVPAVTVIVASVPPSSYIHGKGIPFWSWPPGPDAIAATRHALTRLAAYGLIHTIAMSSPSRLLASSTDPCSVRARL